VRVVPHAGSFADPGARLDDSTLVRVIRDGVVQGGVQYDPSAAAPEPGRGYVRAQIVVRSSR
jgi:hypothetical protein